MPFRRINIIQAKTMIAEDNAMVIDVRDPNSYAAGHIENATHIDNSNVETFIGDADNQLPLIVCCYHGNMSQGAAEFFNSRGFANVYSLDGGYSLWAESD